MQYFLNDTELERMKKGLRVAMGIPFIDDIEDYILEAIWEYTKSIDGVDPFYHIRSKRLYDVVDSRTKTGWSIKSLQRTFYRNCEFELVIQRADVYKKAGSLGFPPFNSDSDPNLIGAALLKHWKIKADNDAVAQNVNSRRIMVLLKSRDKKSFAVFEEDMRFYGPGELDWRWTDEQHNGLQGIRKKDDFLIYRWYPSQKQFFERFVLPEKVQTIQIEPIIRLSKAEVVDILIPFLEGRR